MTSNKYDLGDYETVAGSYFVSDCDAALADGADDDGSEKGDGVAIRRLHGLSNDFRYSHAPLPGDRIVKPGSLLSDDDLLASVDRVALASALRLGAGERLMSAGVKPALVAVARAIGIAPWRQPAPTLEALAADLADKAGVAYRGMASETRDRIIVACGEVLRTLETTTQLPPTTLLEFVFDNASWPALQALVAARFGSRTDLDVSETVAMVEARAEALIAAARLTPCFSAALGEAMRRTDMSVDALRNSSGIPTNKIRKWLLGETPRKDADQAAATLERVLDLPAGTLQALVRGEPGRRSTDDVLDDRGRRYLKAGGVSLAFLPDDWAALSREERRNILKWIDANILHGSPYRLYQRTVKQLLRAEADSMRHAPLPQRIAAELEAVRTFKTSRVPQAVFRRSAKIRSGRRIKRLGGRWKAGSTDDLIDTELRRLVTQLKGLGIDTNNIGLGFLISAKTMRTLTEAIARRRCQIMIRAGVFIKLGIEPPSDGLYYVEGDVNRLYVLRGLFNRETGYLFHNPPRLDRLQTPSGDELIDQNFIDRASADWPFLAVKEFDAIGNYADDLSDEVDVLRDPSFGIQPILDLDAPYQALIDARDRMEEDRPAYLGSPVAAARHDRDHCLVALTIAACPRRKNVGPLTYKQDNHGNDVGHLRRDPLSGQFELHIPKDELKNGTSKALPPGDTLVIVLDPRDTRLYRAIERWLLGEGCSREVLHGAAAGDHLFPGQTGGGICDPLVAQIIYRFSARYLVKTPWRATGFASVLPFGPHAIRDIVATHVVRTTGSLEAAASAIFDTVETVEKRYAHLAARDRGIRNIINIRLGLRDRVDPLAGLLMLKPSPLRLGVHARAPTPTKRRPDGTARDMGDRRDL